MAFQAKRLRVQMPCGETTVFEDQAPVQDQLVLQCLHPSVVPIEVLQGVFCAPTHGCGIGTGEQQGDPEMLIVSPEQLATVRQHLEARLSWVQEAEQAVAAAQASEQ
jgi:hypothetical protein